MAFGIISIIFGVVIFIASFFMGTSAVMQEQVQHIDFVCAALFIIGGVIILVLKSGIDLILIKLDTILSTTQIISAQNTTDSDDLDDETEGD